MKDKTLFWENKPQGTYKLGERKGTVVACVMILIATYVLFLIGVLFWGHPVFYKLLPVLFLLAGCYHAFFIKKHLPGLTFAKRWMFSLGLGMALLLLLACSVLWDQQLSIRGVFTNTGAFLLPFTLIELWSVYEDISYSGIKPWQLIDEDTGDLPTSYLHGQQIRFSVLQEPDINGSRKITVLASGRMKLSDVFFQMVRKQNQKDGFHIALKSREQEPHTWVFYKKDMFLWYRSLDPEKTLLENRIGKNALIYVQRVSQNAFAIPVSNEKNTLEQ